MKINPVLAEPVTGADYITSMKTCTLVPKSVKSEVGRSLITFAVRFLGENMSPTAKSGVSLGNFNAPYRFCNT